jgi:hypothetical protein
MVYTEVQSLLQPNFGKGYCDYFYFIMVIYLLIAVLTITSFVVGGLTHVKGFSHFSRHNLLSASTHLLTVAVQFFVVRLLYSMCANSLPA